jgi:hypothetical protein
MKYSRHLGKKGRKRRQMSITKAVGMLGWHYELSLGYFQKAITLLCRHFFSPSFDGRTILIFLRLSAYRKICGAHFRFQRNY